MRSGHEHCDKKISTVEVSRETASEKQGTKKEPGACVWSVHACRRLQCRRDAWRLCLVSARLSASPVSTCCVALCVVSACLSASPVSTCCVAPVFGQCTLVGVSSVNLLRGNVHGQCTLVGVSSVDVMRGACVWSVHACRRLQCQLVAWHCAWYQGTAASSPVSPHSLSQLFLHVVQSALGGTLVNSLLRFLRFAAQTSV